MKIKTKRKYKLCDNLTNDKEYTFISMFINLNTKSGTSIVVIADNEVSGSFDSNYFRLNSLKSNK